MGKKTPLYDCHLQASAKMVDFAGWDMPLHYGSQIQEHHQVRQDAGMFDVSHMTVVDCKGPETAHFLRHLLANNIDRLIPGKALYSCMLDTEGGVIDDLIVYKIDDEFYRLVVNSGTREKDLLWLEKQSQNDKVTLLTRDDLAMIAVQGPNVHNKLSQIFSDEASLVAELKPFHAVHFGEKFVARTGYTGEEGFEIILPASEAQAFWNTLLSAGILPCGLGARDTLRLEAGLNLYGLDMDEKVSPLVSNLAWTVAFEPKDRDFIGRTALEKQMQAGVNMQLVGLVLDGGAGVLRNHQHVFLENNTVGEITSGSFSPTLNKGIALARIPMTSSTECSVEIRGKRVTAHIIKPPFVRHGKKTFLETSKNGALT